MSSPIEDKYAALGGSTSFLGAPIIPTEMTTPDGIGRYRHYERGSIYWTPQSGAHEVHGYIREKWANMGWEKSFLGYPIIDEDTTPGGAYSLFQHGSIWWTPQTGAHEVHGAIYEKWKSLNWGQSVLGYPISDETATPDQVGRYNHFQHGSIYWSPQTGAHEVHGYIREKWANMSWEKSFLGYPLTDEVKTPDNVGRYNLFQHGFIYWTPQAGAKAVPKMIRNISLVKEQSRPEVYFICGGVKLWIPSAEEFEAAGFRWSDVQVVPDGALGVYRLNHFSAPAKIKPSDVFFDCGFDFRSVTGTFHYNCQNSAALISKNVMVAGWLVEDPFLNIEAHGIEDIHYNIKLDVDFIDRMYGPNGLSSILNNAVYPSNITSKKLLGDALGQIGERVAFPSLPFRDIGPDGTSRGITYNSFILPHNDYDIHGEMNGWHVNETGAIGTRHFIGRGPAPAGWRNIPFNSDTNVWWAFDIQNPDGGPRQLQRGDYVIMKGALWQDTGHLYLQDSANEPWHRGATKGHEGWTELHPVDWVVRVDEPKPAYHKTRERLAIATDKNEHINIEITPDFVGSPVTRQYRVGNIRDLIDGRISDLSTLSNYSVSSQQDRVIVKGVINGTPQHQGRFKASYIISWHETDSRDTVWFNDTLPAGAAVGGDSENWNWVQVNPHPFIGINAHQSANVMGTHQHYFYNAPKVLNISPGDTLMAYVYLDPKAIPSEVMLQWNDGTWEHRAYWGENLINWGIDGTVRRYYIGNIAVVGEWVRLEVPASRVGLENRAISGMAFTLFGGRATWDYAGKMSLT